MFILLELPLEGSSSSIDEDLCSNVNVNPSTSLA